MTRRHVSRKTHVVIPRHLVWLRIGLNQALKINISTFFNIIRIEIWTHFQCYNGHVWRETKNERKYSLFIKKSLFIIKKIFSFEFHDSFHLEFLHRRIMNCERKMLLCAFPVSQSLQKNHRKKKKEKFMLAFIQNSDRFMLWMASLWKVIKKIETTFLCFKLFSQWFRARNKDKKKHHWNEFAMEMEAGAK